MARVYSTKMIAEGITNFALTERIVTKPIKLALAIGMILQEGVVWLEFVGTNLTSSAPIEDVARPRNQTRTTKPINRFDANLDLYLNGRQMAVHLSTVRNKQVYTETAPRANSNQRVQRNLQ